MNVRLSRRVPALAVYAAMVSVFTIPTGAALAADNCCEFTTPFGCASAPGLTAPICTGAGGVFVASQTCDSVTHNCVAKIPNSAPVCDDPPEDKLCAALLGGIPTVSEWGLAVMAILVLTAATVVIMRRRAAVA